MQYKLLFVCLGNICRSPSAENIMKYLLESKSLSSKFICDSAGTSSYHIGSPPDSRMTKAASKRGITLKGEARSFVREDFEKFDLILAMDRHNYRDIMRLDKEGKYKDKVHLMCDYAKKHPDVDVPDPYYGGVDGFDYVIELLLDACENLLLQLVKVNS